MRGQQMGGALRRSSAPVRAVGHLAARAKRPLSRTFHWLFQRSYSSHEVQKNSTDMHIYACLGSPVLLLMSDRTRK